MQKNESQNVFICLSDVVLRNDKMKNKKRPTGMTVNFLSLFS